VYPDANGVPITAAGAVVDVSKYILDAIRFGYLVSPDDPLDIYEPDDRTGTNPDGGFGAALQTQAELEASAIPASIDALEILGCLAAGDGGGGTVKRIAEDSLPPIGFTGASTGTLTAGDGSRWVYVPDSRGVNVRFFGALGDDISSPEENALGINEALFFDMYYARQGCTYIPAGTYTLADTIHIGYGVTASSYRSTTLEGDGKMYAGSSPFGGTALIPVNTDRPVIAVQGTRSPRIKRLAIQGPNRDFIIVNNLGNFDPAVDDTDINEWLGPSLHANANSRYAPFAAIAIDPYAGPRPAVSYPDVVYPESFGAVAQYDKLFSSDVSMQDLFIGGVVVPIVVQPCDADGNADFTSIRDCSFEQNVYGFVSAGNSQSRILQADNCIASQFHTGIANAVHGRQIGKFGSEWRNCHFGACIQWIDLPNGPYAGPMRFVGCYGEQVWRIGNYGNVSASNQPLTFDNVDFSFDSQDPVSNALRGVPPDVLSVSLSSVTFKDVTFTHYESTLLFDGDARFFTFEGTQTYSDHPRANMYEKIAHNFTCDGIMFAISQTIDRPSRFKNKMAKRYNLSTGGDLLTDVVSDVAVSSRAIGFPAWARTAVAESTPDYTADAPSPWIMVLAKSSLSFSMSGLTLTVTSWPLNTYQNSLGGMPGDVIYDSQSGSIFFVRSYSAGTLIAELQNNYIGTTPRVAISPTSGDFYVGLSRIYLPGSYLSATFSASTTVSNVARADGVGTNLTSLISDGDRMYAGLGHVKLDFTYVDSTNVISSVTNGSPGSFVIGANPATTGTRPIGFLVRQAPANV
jgi:hypothetical protein